MKTRLCSMLFLVLWLGTAAPGLGAGRVLNIKSVALMPFGTFKVEEQTINMTVLAAQELKSRGLEVVGQDALETFLVDRRIRRAEFLDRPTIRALGTSLHVDALVTGAVDILSAGDDPQVSMNAQMVDCLEASVIWANSVSRTGQDYAGFLGLGRINSLERLVRVVVKELFEGLPLQAHAGVQAPMTFEVVRAAFSPEVLRSGDRALLSMEIKEILGKVRDIRAFVLDKEVPLETQDGRFYAGTLVAPPIEGTYALRVYITDRWNRLVRVESMARLTVHNQAPRIVIRPRQTLVSPNNDGIAETVLFVPEVLESMALDSWKVEIVDKQGRVVRSEHGVGGLPDGFMWRGVDDEYHPVPDGAYFCRLTARDKAGNRTVAMSAKEVLVDTTPPEIAVHIDAVDDRGVVLGVATTDASGIDYWEILIRNPSGTTIGRFSGKGAPPDVLTLVQKKKIQPG